jgi:hypothetical protein
MLIIIDALYLVIAVLRLLPKRPLKADRTKPPEHGQPATTRLSARDHR